MLAAQPTCIFDGKTGRQIGPSDFNNIDDDDDDDVTRNSNGNTQETVSGAVIMTKLSQELMQFI